jgi:hypothetical protein
MKNPIHQKQTITRHNDSPQRLPWRRCILLLVLGGVLAALSSVFANDGVFDIDELSVDEENRFSNVGAFIVAVVDDSGNLVGLRAHCSGVLIHKQAFLTAGHCVGPGEFGVPPNVKLFVSLGADALDQSTWLAVTRVVPHPSLPTCPGPAGCDRPLGTSSTPAIQAFRTPVWCSSNNLSSTSRRPGSRRQASSRGAKAQTPMTIVGYPKPSPDAEEGDWDGLRRFRTSSLDMVLNEEWATWSLPSNLCFGDSGGPIFMDLHPGAQKENGPLVANVSDGGIDCLSANTNARLDTKAVRRWIKETIREVLGEEEEAED